MHESAILNTGHGPTSIKSVTEPNLILSTIFPNAPLNCRDIAIWSKFDSFVWKIKKYEMKIIAKIPTTIKNKFASFIILNALPKFLTWVNLKKPDSGME